MRSQALPSLGRILAAHVSNSDLPVEEQPSLSLDEMTRAWGEEHFAAEASMVLVDDSAHMVRSLIGLDEPQKQKQVLSSR